MRTTSDELLKKCGLAFITSTEAEELMGESPCMNCTREDCKERIAQNECTAK
jgi:hypothetical protein